MQSTSSEAQVTQNGQAISINNATCTQLYQLFGPMFGPFGTVKVLLGGGDQLTITKDGVSVCQDVSFNHPTAILITRAAVSLHKTSGDGTIGFILMCTSIFNQAFRYYQDGTSIPHIINSLQLALKDATEYVQRSIVPLTDDALRNLALCSLRTKIHNPEFLVDIVIKALISLTTSGKIDLDMVEIMQMEGGDVRDSIFVDGLVLDHSGRHHEMPMSLENVCVLVGNISLEYEKPEINAEFYYSSASQRDEFVKQEKEHILRRARRIAEFAGELKKEGRNLILLTEKGIDPYSLEVLSKAGVLALRRTKRRNIERLINMCGGKVLTDVSQLTREYLGYCQKVTVKDFGENKYTFVEGVPLKGACTILVRGSSDFSRLERSIYGTLQSLLISIQSKCCIYGGIHLYKGIIESLKNANPHECDIVGYKVLSGAFENLIKTLLKNEGKNVHQSLEKINKDGCPADVIENVKVFGNMMTSSVVTAINMLMCDEIIKAGRPIKQDKVENDQKFSHD